MSIIEVAQYLFAFVAVYIAVLYTLFMLYTWERHDEKIGKQPENLPTVSVVIPAYNEEKNIERCIESVLKSRYPKEKLEVVVVDDGSTDKTYQKARRYEKYGVKVLRKPHGGRSAKTKNFGIKTAKGDLIATLDSDSMVEKNTIMEMVKEFDSEEVGAVTSAIKTYGGRGILGLVQKVEYATAIAYKRMLSLLDALPFTPGPMTMFRREVFEQIGLFDEKNITEDLEMALRMHKSGWRIKNTKLAVVYTRIPDTLSSLVRQRSRWNLGLMINIAKHLDLIGPSRGHLGMFFFSTSILQMAFFLFIVILVAYSTANGTILSSMYLSIGPMTVVSLNIFLLGLLYNFLLGEKSIQEIKTEEIVFFSLISPILSIIYWADAVRRMVKGDVRW